MDNRIMNDPHLEVMPDHAGPHYDVLRNALAQNGMTPEQAVAALNDSWTQNHVARVQTWDQQVADDAAAALLALQQQPVQQPLQEPLQPGEEGAEGEKKIVFDTGNPWVYLRSSLPVSINTRTPALRVRVLTGLG